MAFLGPLFGWGGSQNVTALDRRLSALEAKSLGLETKNNNSHKESSKKTNLSGEVDTVAQGDSGVSTNDMTESPTSNKSRPALRMKILVSKVNSNSGLREEKQEEPGISNTTDNANCAFVMRKNIKKGDDDISNDGEIEITSIDLWNLLKGLLSHVPYHTFRGEPTTVYSPYDPFVFNWKILQLASEEVEQGESEKVKQARSDLKLLLDTISTGSGDRKLDKYFKTDGLNKDQKTTTYEALWTLFPPGTLVYGRPFQNQDQLFLVQDNLSLWAQEKKWELNCWIYEFEGSKFKRRSITLEFETFEGHIPIRSLPYYPLNHHENKKEIMAMLVERGKRYRELCMAKEEARMFDYVGNAVFSREGIIGQGDDEEADNVFLRRFFSHIFSKPTSSAPKSDYVRSRVMVDFRSYFRYGPTIARLGTLEVTDDNYNCGCLDCKDNTSLNKLYRINFDEEKNQSGDWDDEQYLLCPPRVLGYVLGSKHWAQLQVTSLQGIPTDPEDSWASRLKFADEGETKRMIFDLVKGHGKTEVEEGNGLQVNDIVRNKGKGLVILLYGPPGVGKTTTAETVAIATRKPLFCISVADVGTKAKNAEANLKTIFALAAQWHAILLIDEADVFLESRGKGQENNTERNALVSVFLRVLEYYHGILILTTNQIAHFDVAVHSRIHVAIKYSNLTKEQKLDIFQGFLGPLAEQGRIKDIEEIKSWLKEDVYSLDIDGRQIRNIITSALSLARARGDDKVSKVDLKIILNNVKDFRVDYTRQFERYKTEQKFH